LPQFLKGHGLNVTHTHWVSAIPHFFATIGLPLWSKREERSGRRILDLMLVRRIAGGFDLVRRIASSIDRHYWHYWHYWHYRSPRPHNLDPYDFHDSEAHPVRSAQRLAVWP
jgi:hypothetical protein